jgi:hypothetical protein
MRFVASGSNVTLKLHRSRRRMPLWRATEAGMTRLARSGTRVGLWLLMTVAAGPVGGALAATTVIEDGATRIQAAPALGAEEGRYSFHRMGEGFIRLDSRTGELSQCGWAASGWSCRTVPDERTALESEIGRLQRENGALKKSLLTHGIDLPGGIVADAPAQAGPVPPEKVPDASRNADPKGPSDADLDRAITFMKNVWQRLVDMVSDLQRDIQKKS